MPDIDADIGEIRYTLSVPPLPFIDFMRMQSLVVYDRVSVRKLVGWLACFAAGAAIVVILDHIGLNVVMYTDSGKWVWTLYGLSAWAPFLVAGSLGFLLLAVLMTARRRRILRRFHAAYFDKGQPWTIAIGMNGVAVRNSRASSRTLWSGISSAPLRKGFRYLVIDGSGVLWIPQALLDQRPDGQAIVRFIEERIAAAAALRQPHAT
jgi:hypothetical protein